MRTFFFFQKCMCMQTKRTGERKAQEGLQPHRSKKRRVNPRVSTSERSSLWIFFQLAMSKIYGVVLILLWAATLFSFRLFPNSFTKAGEGAAEISSGKGWDGERSICQVLFVITHLFGFREQAQERSKSDSGCNGVSCGPRSWIVCVVCGDCGIVTMCNHCGDWRT